MALRRSRQPPPPSPRRPQNTRGRLLTIDEVKQVGQKDELLERAAVLENDSRGWFEEDDELEARLAEVRYGMYICMY